MFAFLSPWNEQNVKWTSVKRFVFVWNIAPQIHTWYTSCGVFNLISCTVFHAGHFESRRKAWFEIASQRNVAENICSLSVGPVPADGLPTLNLNNWLPGRVVMGTPYLIRWEDNLIFTQTLIILRENMCATYEMIVFCCTLYDFEATSNHGY